MGILDKLGKSNETGPEQYLTPNSQAHQDEIEQQKQRKEENFIRSKAMANWMARIVFKDQIELIWASKEHDLQPA